MPGSKRSGSAGVASAPLIRRSAQTVETRVAEPVTIHQEAAA
jgi:hypothetical protein